ncbi:hypothetical protein Tco_1212481 [Tanacetum coccineum]
MLPPNNLSPNESGVFVNETQYRGMIGSLMYLTASRPNNQFSTFLCARYQANPKESYLVAVKRFFRYLKGTLNPGLWYPKGLGFDLKAYSDSDYASCNLDRKITSGSFQILGGKLVCWSAKKQNSVAMSLSEAEYVAAVGCYAQGSHNQLDTNHQVIAYSLIWGLNVDIGNILFSNLVAKLVNCNKGREVNICYKTFLSLIIEHLLGENNKNDKLATFKPHHITAASFNKNSSTSEVLLISYMLKVEKLSKPEKTLVIASREVNTDSTAYKSFFKTVVQSATQSKSSTNKKCRKNKITSSFEPNTSTYIRCPNPKKTVTETQYAEEPVAITDTTQSLDASKSAEELRSQPQTNVSEKVMEEVESDLESMPDDEIMSISLDDNEELGDSENELSIVDEVMADIVADEILIKINTEDITTIVFYAPATEHTSRVKQVNVQTLGAMQRFKQFQITKALRSNMLGHFPRRMDFLAMHVYNLGKSLPDSFIDKMNSMVPKIVFDALKDNLPEILTHTLKDQLPQHFTNLVRETLPGFNQRIKNVIKDEMSSILKTLVLKPLNKELNAPNKLDFDRFVALEQSIHKSVHKNVWIKMGEVAELLKQTPHIQVSTDDDALKKIMPNMEVGGSTPNLSSIKHFRAAKEGLMTIEEA